MKLHLGTKIRELRRRDGRTQDMLAEAFGVTAQAVSRWESGGSYPDMEMIPAIANYFHISIDELFGYQEEREEKIKDVLERATALLTKERTAMYRGCLPREFEDCVNMLRAAAEEFPSEPKILLNLAQALWMWGWNQYGAIGKANDALGVIEEDTDYNAGNVYWKECVRVYEKLLRLTLSAEEREAVICQITTLYCRMGEYEKAKALANEQNSMIVSKEILLPSATVGEEQSRYQGECILALLDNLEFIIVNAVALRPSINSSEYGKELLLSVIRMYETVFIDGRFGKWHGTMGFLYLSLLRYEADGHGDLEKMLLYFDRAFDHYRESVHICNEGNYSYSAPLVSDLKRLEKGELSPVGMGSFWERSLKRYPQSFLTELRRNPKYAECFEREA